MLDDILKGAESVRELVVGFRREMHRNPELSAAEVKTSALVAKVLTESGIEVRRNVGGHGVVGLLRGGGEGPTIALRADMDALPISDSKGVEYASTVEGVMHACGHDVHTAVLLGTALVLSDLKTGLKGNVKFIFQPSEERSATGAPLMIADGVLKDPVQKALVALHCFPEMEAGTVGHKNGVMTASSDRFTIIVKGKSGHASRPHQTVDAVLLAALVINAIHHIVSRRTDPLHHAVISIGTIQGGHAANVIADTVRMEGTVRTLSTATRKRIHALIEETIKGVTHGMGAGYELDYRYGTASVVNDKKVNSFVADCARDILGERNVIEMPDPLMGAEDFACFLEKIPGTLFRLGTGNRAKGITAHLHSAGFDVDEEAIMVGMRLMSWVAARFLGAYKAT